MQYKSLFYLNIHHGYFLDKGEEKYEKVDIADDEMSSEDKDEAIKEYDVSEYLKITPSDFTKTQFRNYRMMMRPSASGFRVLVNTLERTIEDTTKYEPLIPLEDEMYLTFEIQATDEYFYNYSDVFDLTNHRMYLFTNVKPADQDGEFEHLFENNGGFVDNRFLLQEKATRDMVKAIALENENFFELESGVLSLGKTIRLIENNNEFTEEQKEVQIESLLNYTIQKKKKRQVIGYVRLRIKGAAEDHNLLEYINDKQYVQDTTPEFTISFVNIKSFWVFKSTADDATLTTKEQKWLSRSGSIDINTADFDAGGLDPPDTDPEDYTFPNPTIYLINKDDDDNYYSEIFF